MRPNHRSFIGLAIAILSLPVFMGLLACLPVPIGNPEKSRIDPELSGMWIMDGGAVVLIEPFDKRTWLVSMVEIDHDEDLCAPETEGESPSNNYSDSYAELVESLEADEAGCFSADEVELYKAWHSKFGGRAFMTWDDKGSFDDEYGFMSVIWLGFRIDKLDADNFELRMIDLDFDPFDEIEALEEIKDSDPPYDPRKLKSAQRAVEKIIRRNADDDAMYADDPLLFQRVQPNHHDLFIDIIDDVVSTLN